MILITISPKLTGTSQQISLTHHPNQTESGESMETEMSDKEHYSAFRRNIQVKNSPNTASEALAATCKLLQVLIPKVSNTDACN